MYTRVPRHKMRGTVGIFIRVHCCMMSCFWENQVTEDSGVKSFLCWLGFTYVIPTSWTLSLGLTNKEVRTKVSCEFTVYDSVGSAR